MTDSKIEFINTYLTKASDFLDEEQLGRLKDIFWIVSYDYSFDTIQNTEITVSNGNITMQLFKYFYVGKASSGMNEKSLKQYELALRQLIEFTNKELPDLTTDDIMYFFITYKRLHNVSDATMEGKRKYLSSIFAYLTKHKKIKENPMLLIESIKCKQKIEKPLMDEEVETIRINCNNKKETAIVDFLLDTGVRVSELCNIKMGDIDFNNYSAIVTGKGNKEREVYFSGKTAIRLDDYLNTRNDLMKTNFGYQYNMDCPLFINQRNNNAICKESVERIMRDIGFRSGVNRLHPHLFRATFATRLAQNGVSANTIARALGHANLSTVDRYIRMNTKDIEQQIRSVGFN